MHAQTFHTGRREHGIALPIVIVLVLVSALMVLWGFRSSLLNEAVVGSDAAYQRAFEAAQALLQDAELDVSGLRPDGAICVADPGNDKICRNNSAMYTQFVDEEQFLMNLISDLNLQSAKCKDGICIKRVGVQDFWNDETAFKAMRANGVGARYGEFTGAKSGIDSNPLLADRTTDQGGWYWVEVMPYEKGSPGSTGGVVVGEGKDKLQLTLKPSVAYRITSIARDPRANTQVVLQTTYVRQGVAD